MVAIFHKDNVESAGVFLRSQLEQRLPKVYQRKYSALKFANGEYLPVLADLEVGADQVVEEIMDTFGEAGEPIADQIDDIPLADARITETKYPVVVKPIAIRYSVRELAAAQKAGRDIRGMREMAARRAIEESMNKIGAAGDVKRGLTGLLNDPNVDVDNSVTTNLYDPATTADTLIDFFSRSVSRIITNTNMTEEPDTILVPVRLHERMTMLRVGDSGSTVKKFILENNTWIKDILPCNELASSQLEALGVNPVGTNRDAIFIYPRNPEIVHRSVESLQILEPQLRGLVYVVIMLQASTGAINHFPLSALRVSIPRFA